MGEESKEDGCKSVGEILKEERKRGNSDKNERMRERESEGGLRMTEGREDEKWVKSGSGWKREVGCKEKRDMDGHSLDILYYLNLTSLL